MTFIHWHAGWSMPGCLPETPYGTFESREDARAYLVDEYERAWDSGADEDYLQGHTHLHSGSDSVMADGYVWEVTSCCDPGCATPDDSEV